MVIIKPIPKAVLCHSAVLTLKAADKWGKPAFLASGELLNVRFEPVYRHENSSSQNGANYNARLFVDAVNSSCALPLLNVGDEYNGQEITAETVTFSGREYDVTEIKTYYDNVKIHHREVLLNG